jgi:GAF domain-containing protein
MELDRALRTSPSETEGLSALRRLLDAQRVALVRFEHSPGMGQYRSVEAADGEEIFDERHVPMAEFQHELLTRPEAFLIEDLEATDALPPVLSRLRGRGLRSVAGGALVAGGKTVGRLLVCRSGPSPRTAFDRQVAREAGKRFAARFDGAPKSPSVGLEDLRTHWAVPRRVAHTVS